MQPLRVSLSQGRTDLSFKESLHTTSTSHKIEEVKQGIEVDCLSSDSNTLYPAGEGMDSASRFPGPQQAHGHRAVSLDEDIQSPSPPSQHSHSPAKAATLAKDLLKTFEKPLKTFDKLPKTSASSPKTSNKPPKTSASSPAPDVKPNANTFSCARTTPSLLQNFSDLSDLSDDDVSSPDDDAPSPSYAPSSPSQQPKRKSTTAHSTRIQRKTWKVVLSYDEDDEDQEVVETRRTEVKYSVKGKGGATTTAAEGSVATKGSPAPPRKITPLPASTPPGISERLPSPGPQPMDVEKEVVDAVEEAMVVEANMEPEAVIAEPVPAPVSVPVPEKKKRKRAQDVEPEPEVESEPPKKRTRASAAAAIYTSKKDKTTTASNKNFKASASTKATTASTKDLKSKLQVSKAPEVDLIKSSTGDEPEARVTRSKARTQTVVAPVAAAMKGKDGKTAKAKQAAKIAQAKEAVKTKADKKMKGKKETAEATFEDQMEVDPFETIPAPPPELEKPEKKAPVEAKPKKTAAKPAKKAIVMPWDPVSEEEPAPEDLPPKKPASRKPASKKDIAAQNTSPPAPAANSGPAPVSEKAPSSPSAAILKPAFDKVSSPSLAAIPDPTTPVRDLRYSIDQSSGCHAKSLDITTSEAALNPVYSESFQIGHSDAQEERPAEDNEGDGGAADEAGSEHASEHIEPIPIPSSGRKMWENEGPKRLPVTMPSEEEATLTSSPIVAHSSPPRKIEYTIVDNTPSPPRSMNSAIWRRDLPFQAQQLLSTEKTGIVTREAQASTTQKRAPEVWVPRAAPSPSKQPRSILASNGQSKLQVSPLRRSGGLRQRSPAVQRPRPSVNFAIPGRELPVHRSLSDEGATRKPVKVKTRRDPTDAIVQVLNDIHEEVVKKLVYKFAQVEKKSKADRENLITQAREDIGKIQRNSIKHYNDLVEVQEAYCQVGGKAFSELQELERVSMELLAEMEKGIAAHDAAGRRRLALM